jgi:hypothetical protein
MKILHGESTDPFDCFENRHCRWRDPAYRLEPGRVVWFPSAPLCLL